MVTRVGEKLIWFVHKFTLFTNSSLNHSFTKYKISLIVFSFWNELSSRNHQISTCKKGATSPMRKLHRQVFNIWFWIESAYTCVFVKLKEYLIKTKTGCGKSGIGLGNDGAKRRVIVKGWEIIFKVLPNQQSEDLPEVET